MMNVTRALGLFVALSALPAAAEAAATAFVATLSGDQEVPLVNTPGTGEAKVVYDDVTNLLFVEASFSGLLGNTTIAHIHCCALPGANAGVVTPVPSFPGFPAGVTSGSYSQTFDLTQASSFNPAFITANGNSVASARQAFVNGLFGGQAYFNIHTSVFSGGEIRGQLAAVPEPASWAMMIGGFGLVGFALRQRSRVRASFA